MGTPAQLSRFCKRYKIPMTADGRPDPQTLDQTLRLKRFVYPSIALTRESMIEHIYVVNGNGYHWEDGRCATNWPTATEMLWDDIQSAKRKLEMDARFSLYDKPRGRGKKKRRPNRERKVKRQKELWHEILAREKRYPMYRIFREKGPKEYYPIGGKRYARLLEVPDDVKGDWLDGAYEMIGLLLNAVPSERNDRNREYAIDALRDLDMRFGRRRVWVKELEEVTL